MAVLQSMAAGAAGSLVMFALLAGAVWLLAHALLRRLLG